MRSMIVTGASSGIGKATALRALEKGYKVIGISRSKKISHQNYEHLAVDLSIPKEYQRAFLELKKRKDSIDAIVCNAGLGLFGHIEELKFSDIEKLYQVNVLSHIFLVQALLPQMKKSKSGDIIFMCSEASLQGKRKGSIYCSSKFALRGFAQALRDESASSGMRVSIINPGFVKTSFYDELKFSHTDDKMNYITADQVAHTVHHVLEADRNLIFDEVVIRPPHHSIMKK